MQSRQFTVTVPSEIAAKIEAKVRSGQYASESDVFCDGILALEDREQSIEEWLREEVIPAYDALKADPDSAISIDDVDKHLIERYRRETKPA